MLKRRLPQEGLKLIACVTMLVDHIGAVLLPPMPVLRIVGRLAFPIYCFLLAEGVAYTKNPKKYGQRLLIGALLAEIPFDLAIFGQFTWTHQNVMVTLLLGFGMLEAMKRTDRFGLKMLLMLLFAYLAEWMHTDYGSDGILVIALFVLTRQMPYSLLWQFLGLWCIFSPGHLMALNWLKGFAVALQELAVLAIVPISVHDGRKITNSKIIQWAFYLFYPAHLLVLYLIEII